MSVEFLDTNILLYAIDAHDRRKHERVKALLTPLLLTGKAAVSIQVLTEFYAIATRKMKFPAEEVREMISDYDYCILHTPARSDIFLASHIQQRYNLSWWDALMLNSAQQLNASILWTEDLNHNQAYGNLTVKNPFLD
jgi:predicted nucleic acid-binding protein